MRVLKILLVFLLLTTSCFAIDWVWTHNKVDTITLKEALSDVDSAAGSTAALYKLGLVYLNLYKAHEARQVFEKILEIDPQSIEARWGLAEILRREHWLTESAEMLKVIIQKAPDFAPALISLAYIEYVQGNFDASIRLTGRVINLQRESEQYAFVDNTNFLRAHGLYAAAKGMIAHYGGPISKAINGASVLKHLNIIQKLAPDSSVVNFGLGSYYMLTPKVFGQDLEKAQEYLEKAIAADPLFANPYVRLAQIYKKKGDMQKYEEFLNKVFELDPGNELAIDVKSGECFFICLD